MTLREFLKVLAVRIPIAAALGITIALIIRLLIYFFA